MSTESRTGLDMTHSDDDVFPGPNDPVPPPAPIAPCNRRPSSGAHPNPPRRVTYASSIGSDRESLPSRGSVRKSIPSNGSNRESLPSRGSDRESLPSCASDSRQSLSGLLDLSPFNSPQGDGSSFGYHRDDAMSPDIRGLDVPRRGEWAATGARRRDLDSLSLPPRFTRRSASSIDDDHDDEDGGVSEPPSPTDTHAPSSGGTPGGHPPYRSLFYDSPSDGLTPLSFEGGVKPPRLLEEDGDMEELRRENDEVFHETCSPQPITKLQDLGQPIMQQVTTAQKTEDDIIRESFEEADAQPMGDEWAEEGEEPMTHLEMYKTCWKIRRRRYFENTYNIWVEQLIEAQRDQAAEILQQTGFDPAARNAVESLVYALRRVPDRFYVDNSINTDISVLELKTLVDESMSAFEDLSRQREQARRRSTGRRRARGVAACGVGATLLVSPASVMKQHLSLNLLNLNIPAYYMESYERRYKESSREEYEEEENGSDSD